MVKIVSARSLVVSALIMALPFAGPRPGSPIDADTRVVLGGTVIFIAPIKTGILISADRVRQYRRHGIVVDADEVVKIEPVNRFTAIATVGDTAVAHTENGKRFFDAAAIARDWLATNALVEPFDDALEPLLDLIKQRYKAFLNGPESTLSRPQVPPNWVFQIVVAHWNKKTAHPEVAVLGVDYEGDENGYTTVGAITMPDLTNISAYGESNAVATLAESPAYGYLRNDPSIANYTLPYANNSPTVGIRFCRKVIEDVSEILPQIDYGNTDVGPTVDIASFTSSGFSWVYRDKGIPSQIQ